MVEAATKPDLPWKSNTTLYAQSAYAQLLCPLHGKIEKSFVMALKYVFRQYAYGANGHDENDFSVNRFDLGANIRDLTDKTAVLFHDEVKLRRKVIHVAAAMKYKVLKTAGTVNVPECLTDEISSFFVVCFYFRSDAIVIFIHCLILLKIVDCNVGGLVSCTQTSRSANKLQGVDFQTEISLNIYIKAVLKLFLLNRCIL